MGGPLAGAPPIPPGAPGQKMARLRDGRAKSAYALIYKHVSDGDLRTILFTNHFQDGHGAIQYLDTVYDTPITRSELREMDKLWTELTIAQDIGIQQDSVSRFAKLLQRVNSERPAANRYNLTEMCEKLLEAIADASRHFNEGAMREYDAAVGSRQFEYPAAHPLFANQRNFGACVHYYDAQWKQAVKSKILTVTAPLRRSGNQVARMVVDRGMRVSAMHKWDDDQMQPPSEAWELQEMGVSGFLKQCFDVKEIIEHKGHLTGAQSMMVLHQLMKDAAAETPLDILNKFPIDASVKARAREHESIPFQSTCEAVQSASVCCC